MFTLLNIWYVLLQWWLTDWLILHKIYSQISVFCTPSEYISTFFLFFSFFKTVCCKKLKALSDFHSFFLRLMKSKLHALFVYHEIFLGFISMSVINASLTLILSRSLTHGPLLSLRWERKCDVQFCYHKLRMEITQKHHANTLLFTGTCETLLWWIIVQNGVRALSRIYALNENYLLTVLVFIYIQRRK